MGNYKLSAGMRCNKQFDDVGVTQQLKIFNLSFDTASHVSTDELFTGNNFEGDLLSGALVNGQPHFAKGTLSQRPDYFVGADALLGLGLVSR
jgi:hypothetical protein